MCFEWLEYMGAPGTQQNPTLVCRWDLNALAVAWIRCLTLANGNEEGAELNLQKVLLTEMPKYPEEQRNVSCTEKFQKVF